MQFYYLMQVPDELFRENAPTFASSASNDLPVLFQWHALAELESLPLPLYPAMLCSMFRRLPETLVHPLTRSGITARAPVK